MHQVVVGACSVRRRRCAEENTAASREVKSTSSGAGLTVEFMSPTGSQSAAASQHTDSSPTNTRTSQRIANYAVASASASSTNATSKDKDTKDVL